MSNPHSQLLILVKGLPGCGKSTLATALARALRCPLVDKDDARDCFQPLVGAAPHVDWNALSYTVMFQIAERQLTLGLHAVVMDCPFARKALYDKACELAARVAALAEPATEGSQVQKGEVEVEGEGEVERGETVLAAAAPPPPPAPTDAADGTPAATAATAAAVAPVSAVAAAATMAAEATAATAAATEQVVAAAAGGSTAAAKAAAVPEQISSDRPTGRSPGPGSVRVVLVDVECGDEAVWRRRVETRGSADRDTERGHKPCSWEELQALLLRYDGCWTWSTDGSVALPYHMRVCTASDSTEQCVRRVLDFFESRQLLRLRPPAC